MVAGGARVSSDWDDRGYIGGVVGYKTRVFCHHLIIRHVSLNAVLNIHAHFLFVHVTACASAGQGLFIARRGKRSEVSKLTQCSCQDNTIHISARHRLSFLQQAGAAVLWSIVLDLDFTTLLPSLLSLFLSYHRQPLLTITPQSLLSCSQTVLSSILLYALDSQHRPPGTNRLTGFNSHGPTLSSCQHWHPAALQHLSQETKLQ
jgi:hypothetical protein